MKSENKNFIAIVLEESSIPRAGYLCSILIVTPEETQVYPISFEIDKCMHALQ